MQFRHWTSNIRHRTSDTRLLYFLLFNLRAEVWRLRSDSDTRFFYITNTTPTIHKIPLIPPLPKGEIVIPLFGNPFPVIDRQRGARPVEWGILLHRARGDFLIKPLNISVLHRAINAICRSITNCQAVRLSSRRSLYLCLISGHFPSSV